MSDTYTRYPSVTSQAVPTVPNEASLPATGAYDGELYLTTDTDSLYAWNQGSMMWVLLNSSSTVTGSGTNGKLTVWTGASSLGDASGTGILSVSSGTPSAITNGTANQVLGMNNAANGFEYKSILGTANQVTVTHGANSVTLSTPQSIAPGSSPTFTGLTLSGLSTGVVHSNGSGVLSSSTIVNADVSASAAIALTKLEAVTAASVVMGNGSNVATATTVSGDITINSSGVTAIGAGKVTSSMLAGSIGFDKLSALSSGNILVGNGSNVAASVAMSGDVTISNAGVTAIGTNKVTNSMLAQVATQTFKGRTTASTGNVEDLTATQATAMLNVFTAPGGGAGLKGLVPSTLEGDENKFLRGDGTWAGVPGAALTSGHIFVGNGSNLAADVAMSGDATIASGGSLTIASGAVTGAKIASATITGSNLSSNINLPGNPTAHSGNNQVLAGVSNSVPLLMVRGTVASNGLLSAGEGIDATGRSSLGVYAVTVSYTFSGNPSVVVLPHLGTVAANRSAITTTGFQVTFHEPYSPFNLVDTGFDFILIGPA
jgi:hypothetical protein